MNECDLRLVNYDLACEAHNVERRRLIQDDFDKTILTRALKRLTNLRTVDIIFGDPWIGSRELHKKFIWPCSEMFKFDGIGILAPFIKALGWSERRLQTLKFIRK